MFTRFLKNKIVYGLFVLSSCFSSVKAQESPKSADYGTNLAQVEALSETSATLVSKERTAKLSPKVPSNTTFSTKHALFVFASFAALLGIVGLMARRKRFYEDYSEFYIDRSGEKNNFPTEISTIQGNTEQAQKIAVAQTSENGDNSSTCTPEILPDKNHSSTIPTDLNKDQAPTKTIVQKSSVYSHTDEELRHLGVKPASDLKNELLKINNFSMVELTQTLQKGGMPSEQIASVKEGLKSTRDAQYQRLVAIRRLNYIAQERRRLSALAKAGDKETLGSLKAMRWVLTEERRKAVNQATDNKLLDLKDQRRQLAKKMRIALRRNDTSMQEDIKQQRQKINLQEKEIRAYIRGLKYQKVRQSFLKPKTIETIKAHHKSDKKEKRRVKASSQTVTETFAGIQAQELLSRTRAA